MRMCGLIYSLLSGGKMQYSCFLLMHVFNRFGSLPLVKFYAQ